MVREVCQIDQTGQLLLKTAMTKLQLSARAYDRILKVARTIADLISPKRFSTEVWIEKVGQDRDRSRPIHTVLRCVKLFDCHIVIAFFV